MITHWLYLKSDSHHQKKFLFICFNESPLKIMKSAFYKLFCSQDIQIFVLTIWLCRRSGLLRKIRLISKIFTSQPGWKTITIHTFPNISQSKGNQTSTLSFFFEKHAYQKFTHQQFKTHLALFHLEKALINKLLTKKLWFHFRKIDYKHIHTVKGK